MIDAEDLVEETLEELVAFRARVQRNLERSPELADLLSKCDLVLQLAPRRGGTERRTVTTRTGTRESIEDITENSLADLHKRLKASLVAAERARWEWDDLLEKTFQLESLIIARRKLMGVVDVEEESNSPPNEVEEEPEGVTRSKFGEVGYYFKVRGYTLIYKTLSVITMCCSVNLLWCAVISPLAIQLSTFGALLHQAGSPFAIWLFSFFPLAYIGACVYTALFKFRYLDVLALHGNHQTDAYNLLYNASYMARLQFSLGVFFFQMIYPQDSLGTSFHRLVGDMDTMPLLGENFNKFSPILILFFSAASLLNCGDRFLDFLGINRHETPRRGVREHEERIEEGKRLIEASRSRRERDRRRLQMSGTNQTRETYVRRNSSNSISVV